MKKLTLIVFGAISLVGCATGGSSTKSATVAPVPTYNEKAGAVALSDFNAGGCPADGKWEGPDWRKALASANACVKAKDWRKVELIGNYLAVSAHLTPWGSYYMSLSAQNRKDYPRAVWMVELALKKAPNEGLFHYQMGRLYWEQGQEQLALKSLKQASDLNANLTGAHYIMAQMALQKESYAEAEKLFRKALAADSKHWPSLMGMATVKMKSYDWTNAVVYLEDGVRQNPRSAKARLALAQIHETQIKNLQEALSVYKELRSQAMAKKLDEPVVLNLDEKISALEKSASQVSKGKELVRKPTAEGQVRQ
jgi:tetratricopeptide (TPR) repeat protein